MDKYFDATTQAELKQKIADLLIKAQHKPGVSAVIAEGSLNAGTTTTVRHGVVESIEFNRNKAIKIIIYKGRAKGSVSITSFKQEDIAAALNSAYEIASYAEPDIFANLPEPKLLAKNYPDLKLYHPIYISCEQAIAHARTIEEHALQHPQITQSDSASFSQSENFFILANSNGFMGGYPSTNFTGNVQVIAGSGANMRRDCEYTIARDFADLTDFSLVGQDAATKAVAALGARAIPTTKAAVLFTPKAAKNIWSALVAALLGTNLYRHSSFLEGKLGEQIFPEFINISEQPHILKAIGSAPFDADGLATINKNIIQDGKIANYILSYYAAKKLGLAPTANAGGVRNLVVEPHNYSFAQLLQKMQRGLVVTHIMGHGTNIVTGDYSHGVSGFWVENGQISLPVQEVTIAANLLDIFKNVINVGNDQDTRGNIITGSLLVDKMTVAGI